MADKSPINGNVLDQTQYIFESARNTDRTEDWGRIPKLEPDGYLSSNFVRSKHGWISYQDIDGSVTPKAVNHVNGDVYVGDEQKFFGFTADDTVADDLPDFLNRTGYNLGAGVSSFSFTANAGTDRVIVIFAWWYNTETPATGCTWNGHTLVLEDSINFDATGGTIQMWVKEIGTAGSAEADTVAFTGGGTGGGNTRIGNALVYDNTDQTTPMTSGNTETKGNTGTSVETDEISSDSQYALFIAGSAYSSASINTSGFTSRGTISGNDCGDIAGLTGQTISASRTGSGIGIVAGALNSASAGTSIEVIDGGIVGGFTGLTVEKPYFISDTSGGISLTGSGARVGVAISATEILIDKERRRAVGVANSAGRVELGFRPSIIRAHGYYNDSGSTGSDGMSSGCWHNGVYAGAVGYGVATVDAIFTDAILKGVGTVTITGVDDTGFTITGLSQSMTWEAEE